ncbi:DoxX-like family protein [Maribacter sedimenticola]|uniref:DoxX-like family protein n=1 Tax=Maribacter sedimenticola TaxID=228956 RepID=A0ABY1SGG4_9FLAO|nr:DoxX family protein [Maribacter sedimenticola]SNR45726.1 DoxX-like family protein [Maribacter sedimenticola]
MNYFLIACQLIVGLSILNVWLIQYKKETKWRGGNAKTIIEEFKVYGLSETMCYIVGFLKVTLAILLMVGIWVPKLTQPAALGLAALLLGSIVMHLKIQDPLFKSFPAALFLTLCLLIVFL